MERTIVGTNSDGRIPILPGEMPAVFECHFLWVVEAGDDFGDKRYP